MAHTTTTITAPDGIDLLEHCWTPDDLMQGQQPRGVLLFVHGITEYTGRYDELAERVNALGVVMAGHDLRGHGQSGGPRVAIQRFSQYVGDLQQYASDLRHRWPDVPMFVMGHSMGGAIVARWVIEHRPRLDGLLLSAPAIFVGRGIAPWFRNLSWLGDLLFPRAKLLRLGATGLSRDPDVVAQFRADPLVHHGTFAVRTGTEILRTGRIIRHRAAEIDLPLFTMHGTADLATNPRGTALLHEKVSSRDKTHKRYPGLFHDLVHEPEKEQVLTDLTDWLRKRIS